VKKLIASLLALTLTLPPVWASNLPDLGESSRQYLSDKQERELARAIMRDVYASPLFLSDPEVEAYLNGIGAKLSSESSRSERSFTFFAVRDPSINAFALPGGFIGVHTGLIQTAENESELAGVLAHEIAHVSQEHLSRMIAAQDQSYLPTLAAIAVAILAARSNANVGSAAIATAQALNIQSQLNFTREHEREADRVGLETLTSAGFDPAGLSSFFNRLQRANRLYDTNAPDYLRTHPLNSQRIADMDARVEKLPYRQVKDSIEFHLVRARLIANEGLAEDAVRRFQDQIKQKKTLFEAASRYGLSIALSRQAKYAEAEAELAKALKFSQSPMLLNLQAELAGKTGNTSIAIERYRSGIARHPHYKPLLYGYVDALILAGRAREAAEFAATKTTAWPDDARLWKLLARAEAALNHRLASHRAEAESLAVMGNLPAALEQINIGLKAGDGNFYELSSAEARRREWQAMLAAETAKK
jgi:predicted Zn-dependent protease